jgi:hypothetical protein
MHEASARPFHARRVGGNKGVPTILLGSKMRRHFIKRADVSPKTPLNPKTLWKTTPIKML